MQRRIEALVDDISADQNRYFLKGLNKEPKAQQDIFAKPNLMLIFDYIKRYCETLSSGYAHIDITMHILDGLLTKRYI